MARRADQLSQMLHEKKGNPKSSAGLKKPKEPRFFDFFPNNYNHGIKNSRLHTRDQWTDELTDGISDRWTNGPTDGQSLLSSSNSAIKTIGNDRRDDDAEVHKIYD